MHKTEPYQWTDADEVRNRLRGLVIYRTLVDALWPGAFEHPVVESALREVARWVETASDTELLEQGGVLHNHLMDLKEKAKEMLPPKCSESQILADFQYCGKNGEFSWDRGIQFKWVSKWFDTSNLPVPIDFPLHGIVGVGRYAGRTVVEEAHLLRDSYFLRAKVKQCWSGLEECMRRDKRNKEFPHREQATSLNMNLSCFARLAVFNFYSFVECFVNSVANDFMLRTPGLTQEERELLSGMKKGKYLGVEYKLEKFPGIIRGDNKVTIVLSDQKQQKEPFVTFAGILKNLRGATAHFSVNKSPIWLKPQQWIENVDAAATTCLEVSRKYWDACYPGRDYPDYLFKLDAEHVERIANDAVTDELNAREVLDYCMLH